MDLPLAANTAEQQLTLGGVISQDMASTFFPSRLVATLHPWCALAIFSTPSGKAMSDLFCAALERSRKELCGVESSPKYKRIQMKFWVFANLEP
jgi:hypothetical protein